MINLLLFHRLCFYIISVNIRDTKDAHMNNLVQTVSAQIIIQPDIIAPYLMATVDGTEYSIVYI